MTLTIRADETRSAGGYAVLSFTDGAAATVDSVSVAVMETFGNRWLVPSAQDASGQVGIGDPNWQAGRHEFGPYPLLRRNGRLELVIGPEIVNKIEGYTNLRIVAGPLEGTASWPDDIAPLAGATALGGLQVMRKAVDAAPRPSSGGKSPLTIVEQTSPETDPALDTLSNDTPDLNSTPKRPLTLLVGLAALILLLLAGAAWWFTRPDAPPPAAIAEPAPPEPAPAEPPVIDGNAEAAVDPCTLAALRAVEGGLPAQLAQVAGCEGSVTADTLLSLIEDAAAQENGDALLLFGALYDSAETDTLAESTIGLTFGDVPAQAAEYYARAAAQGATGAQARLDRVCAALVDATDTLSQGARDDFCP